jgi:periplasmic divalent cation tolerance protein
MSLTVILSSIGSSAEADTLARQLVNEKLAACVVSLPEATATYFWEGAVEQARDVVLLIKTPSELAPKTIARITELHPYKTPEIIGIDATSVNGAYLEWALASTRLS